MSVKERYGTMMDSAFGSYYEMFREKGALSKEQAVTMEELFDGGKISVADRQMFHKMLSFGVVKREGGVRYWLNEEKAVNPGKVLTQRILIIAAAMAVALGYCIIMGDFKF